MPNAPEANAPDPNAACPDTAALSPRETRQRNIRGGGWLLADMICNIWALSIIKALGLDYPAAQLVFLRASVGLGLILPWIWYNRQAFRQLPDLSLHILRVALSTLALALGYFALARLPFALFSAMNFIRPVILMLMAATLLGERISRRQWIAAAVAFLGVLIALQPGSTPWSLAIPALMVALILGTSAIIVIRRLSGTPEIVLMTFYVAGLSVLTAPFAWAHWHPIASGHLIPLLAIGVFSQTAQLCFLRAHARAQASFLAILSYFSLILTTSVGYLVFDEVPSPTFALGAMIIVAAAASTTLRGSRQSPH